MDKVIFSGIVLNYRNPLWFEEYKLSNIKFIKGSKVDFGDVYYVSLTIFPASIYKDYTCLYFPESDAIAIYKDCIISPIRDFCYTELVFYTRPNNLEDALKIDAEIHEILNNGS